MSRIQNSETVDILEKIGELYLNESYADVVFVVDGERLPAHRNILGLRCPIFKTMFLPNSEVQKQVIELPETKLPAFKTLLKFIYTGTAAKLYTITLDDMFDVLSVAKTYEMSQLEELCLAHLKSDCAINNVHCIIQEGLETSNEALLDLGLNYVDDNFEKFVETKALINLSSEGLNRVLQKMVSEVSEDTVICALVDWMKRNPRDSEHFPELIKRMDLKMNRINDIVAAIRPLNLVADNVLLDLVCEQTKKAKKTDALTSVTTAKTSSIYVNPSEKVIMKHVIGNGNDNITIDLEQLFLINSLEFELADGNWSYWIEVSKDNVNWTRIIDYSKYICRSFQRLYFQKQPLRYIRIRGTAPANGTFEISSVDAYYETHPLEVDPETNVAIPTHNVASTKNNAIVIQKLPGKIAINTSNDCVYLYLDRPVIVQLPQPYLIGSMNIMLNSECLWSYNIEVSTDNVSWTRVFSEDHVNSFRCAEFDKQPVVFIKVTSLTIQTGIHNSSYCAVLVCPAIPADTKH